MTRRLPLNRYLTTSFGHHGRTPDIRERMSVQAQAVGAWEKRNHIPEEKRLTSWEPNMQVFVPLPQATMEQLARRFELALDFPTVTALPMRPGQHRPSQRGGR